MWVPDKLINNCTKCKKQFSTMLRKHHCRLCGLIFCNECCKNYIKKKKFEEMNLPDQNIIERPSSFFNKYVSFYVEKNVRVCSDCFNIIDSDNFISESKLNEIFKISNFDMKTLKVLSLLSKKWYKVSSKYIGKVNFVKYMLPNKLFEYEETNFLKTNVKHFIGHSFWSVKYLLMIEQLYPSMLKKYLPMMRYLDGKYTSNHENLNCPTTCSNELNIDNIIELLSYSRCKKLRFFALKILKTYDIDTIILYIPILVYNMRFDLDQNETKKSGYLQKETMIGNFLLKYSCKSQIFFYHYYYQLKCNLRNNSTKLFNFYKFNMLKLKKYSGMYTNVKRWSKLKNILKEKHEFTGKHLEMNYFSLTIKLDVDNQCIFESHLPHIFENVNVFNIDYENLNYKQSATRPIFIPFDENENCILYKNENVRNDYFVTNLIKIFNNILKEETDLEINILTYDVLPTSENDGFIQIVNNAETIYKINGELGFTILNYILEKNVNESVHSIKIKFAKSVAAYCVISYLLVFGDRHLENIMITNDGQLFHIDFGCILGSEPKIFSPDIKLTAQMLEVLGGFSSSYYKKFKKYCNLIYKVLRSHFGLIFEYIKLLTDKLNLEKEFTIDQVKKIMDDRFLLEECIYSVDEKHFEINDESIIEDTFSKIINLSQCSKVSKFHDLLHYVRKEHFSFF